MLLMDLFNKLIKVLFSIKWVFLIRFINEEQNNNNKKNNKDNNIINK